MNALHLPAEAYGPAGPRRTAAVAAWLQRLYDEAPPILVGGAAVEVYTSGGYVTGDLDFVGRVPPEVANRLGEAGFTRRGRHWIHEGAKLFLEFPGERVKPDSEGRRLRTHGRTISIIGPEALVADRLAAWKYWRSSVDAFNALLLIQRWGARMNGRQAAACARELGVEDERRRLSRFARRLRGRKPTAHEMARWLESGGTK